MMSTMSARRRNIVNLYETVGPVGNYVPIIQPAIQQRPDSCGIAAVSTHIGYNLRISYASHSHMPIELPAGPLIDHEQWEDEFWGEEVKKVWDLLQEAKQNGVPLWNRLRLYIDQPFTLVQVSENLMRQRLGHFTVLAVINIYDDYSADGETPYMGRGQVIKDKEGDKQAIHAVVIVGEYKDDSLFNADEVVERLWIYQNSDGVKSRSFLKNGLNVVRHSLIVEAYCGETYGASVVLQDWAATVVEPYRDRPHVQVPRLP